MTLEERNKKKSFNKRCMAVGYVLTAVAAAFYYGVDTNESLLQIGYVLLGVIGMVVLTIFTYRIYSNNVRTKVLISNVIYLAIINALGILSKFYGGVIAFFLIIITIFLYEKYLKRFPLKVD